MPVVGSFVKLLDEVKDYVLDWSDELGPDTISTSVWAITPLSSPPLVQDSESETASTSTIFLSGGMVGEDYTLENTIVTVGGRTCVASIEVRVSYLVQGVTSYIEAIPADSYFAKSQNAIWLALNAAAREGFIIRSTRLLNRQNWLDDYDTLVKRVAVQDIVDACAELAADLAEGSSVEDEQTTAQKLQSIKAGSVALTYFRGAEGVSLRFPQVAHELLSKYLAGTGGSQLAGVVTGVDGVTVTAKDYGFNRGV